jgi:hypothetical protein
MVEGNHCADHATPSSLSVSTTSPGAAVDQSVLFACGLKATEFVFVLFVFEFVFELVPHHACNEYHFGW